VAKLPGLELRPREGARPVIDALEPTDLGLKQAAANLEGWAQAEAKKRQEADAKAVRPELEDLATNFGRDFETDAAKEDGTQGGFTQRQRDRFDAVARAYQDKAQALPNGQRQALLAGIDRQRIAFGQKALEVETHAAGQLAAERERARQNGVVNSGFAAYQTAFAPEAAKIDQGYDGTSPTYEQDVVAAHDAAAASALEATPEADRAALQVKLDNQRLDLMVDRRARAEKLQLAAQARQVGQTLDTLSAATVSDPNAISANLKALPGLVADLPGEIRQKVQDQSAAKLVGARIEGLINAGDPAQAVKELNAGRWDAYLDGAEKARLLGRTRGEAGQRARDLLDVMRYGGQVDGEAADAAAAASGDPGLQQEIRYRREVGWGEESALGDGFAGGGRKSFQEIASFVIDDLEGGDRVNPNDNGRGASKFGFTQAFHPDIDVTKLTKAEAVTRSRRYWNAVGGDRLAPDMALVAFDAAFNQGPDKAARWVQESGGDVGRYLALREADYRRLAKSDPAKYGDDLPGWLKRLDKVRAEAARTTAFVNVRDGMASDPIKFAVKSPALRAQIPGLPGDPGEAGWGAALKQRFAVGRQLNERYQAPLRMLTDAEAAYYKDQIERDPKAALGLAQAALAAVGPVATRSLLGEVGQQGAAGVHLHLADLYAMGSQEFAQRAETGLALKGKGVSLDKQATDDLKAAVDQDRGAFGGDSDLMLTVRGVAEAAMLADQQAGKAKPARSYLLAAVGGTVAGGRRFGGLASLNGRATILPHWLSPDYADEALEVMADSWQARGVGPVYTNGQPVPARELRRSSLQLTPSGNYVIIGPRGAALTTKAGKPFAFDWDTIRPGLRARLGANAVLAP
jgi:lysozyme family protein